MVGGSTSQASVQPNRAITMHHQYNLILDGDSRVHYQEWMKARLLRLISLGFCTHIEASIKQKWLTDESYFLGVPFVYHADASALYALRAPFLLLRLYALLLFTIVYRIDVFAPDFWPVSMGIMITLAFSESLLGFLTHKFHIERTSWGKHQGRLKTTGTEFAFVNSTMAVLALLSFGLLLPAWRNRRFALKFADLSFGDLRTEYTGRTREILDDYQSWIPVCFTTFGCAYPWMKSRLTRYRFTHLWIGGDRIGSARGFYLAKGLWEARRMTTSILASLVTLGFADLWIAYKDHQYFLHKLSFIGNLNLDEIHQFSDSEISVDRTQSASESLRIAA